MELTPVQKTILSTLDDLEPVEAQSLRLAAFLESSPSSEASYFSRLRQAHLIEGAEPNWRFHGCLLGILVPWAMLDVLAMQPEPEKP